MVICLFGQCSKDTIYQYVSKGDGIKVCHTINDLEASLNSSIMEVSIVILTNFGSNNTKMLENFCKKNKLKYSLRNP